MRALTLRTLTFRTWTALALAVFLPLFPAPRAEAASARENAGTVIDSLTHAPPAQDTFGQGKFDQGKSRQNKPGQGFAKQPAPKAPARSGPTAPAAPKAPLAPEVAPRPAGAPWGQPRTGAAPVRAAAPEPKPAKTPRRDSLLLEHEGRERLAVVCAPRPKAQKKGQPAARLPLVIFLHGAGGSASQGMQQTRLAEFTERAGFIAVFPEGLSGPDGQDNGGIRTWNAWMCCGYARDQRIDDVGFLSALISRLKAEYPVDPRRIHLAGFSNGAMLASRFALEQPGVIASLASVAGYLPCDAQAPQEPLPVLVIHGNRDRMARFGPTEARPRTGRFCEDFPAKAQVEHWVRGMGLKAKAQVQDGKKSRVRVERYGPDKKTGRALVEFVIVKGGGHAWPGGARERYRYCDLPTPDPDASALVLDFFRRTAKPGPPDKTAKAIKTEKPPKAAKGRG